MIGEQIGPYRVTASLGRGGMGEVYRAHDERLDRDVALKVLPPEFAGDPERLARFQREARMLAVLQHQNIAAIYGLEEHGGHPVLVMELVEGDDLSVRLGGPVPADEVEKIARQLAAGLEYAHEQGIVHRDLKPANIKLGPAGRVKILDFGLARAFEGPAGASGTSAGTDPTVTRTRDLTGAGAVIGTAAYMSPEQSRGYAVDRRTDIWAFGVILFEMLTGRRLFAGETASDTLAAVLRHDPDWNLVPPDAPPVLVQLCQRCLMKDPQLRLRDIGEARVALDGTGSTMLDLRSAAPGPVAATAGASNGLAARVIAVAGVAAAILLGFLGFTGRIGPEPPEPERVRSTVILEPGQGLYLNPGNPGCPVISPDGRQLAFVAQDSSGAIMLCVRALASDEVQRIPGTAGAAYLFWAPDSRRVGFFAGGQLNTVDTGGGPVVPVCAAENAKGGSWNDADEILFTPTHASPIYKVDANGGAPVAVTDPDRDANFRSHRFPRWLPDGRHFLYLAWFRGGAGHNHPETVLRLASVEDTVTTDLMPCQTDARYAAGHLLYIHEGNLMARPFDLGSLSFSGPTRPLVGEVLSLGAAHYGTFSATDAGVLAFVGQGGAFGNSRLAWVEGQDKVAVLDQVKSVLGFALSPDGKRIAISMVDDQQGSFDVWIHDIARDLATRLTFAADSEMGPAWSPDGRWVAYSAEEAGLNVICRKPASGGGRPEVLVKLDTDLFVDSFAPDGRTLSFTKTGSDGGFSVWLLDLESGEAHIYREVPYNMAASRFSPDGRWLAYTSDETGQPEVFVEAVVPDGGRWRISGAGGQAPVWAPGGDAIYYVDTSGDLHETEIVATESGLAIGRTRTVTRGLTVGFYRTFSVDPTSGRVMVEVPAQENLSNRVEIVTNWQQLLVRGGD